MKQLTIRGFDERLDRALRALAREREISLNRAALLLMRRGAELAGPALEDRSVGSALDRFIGVWSEEEERELLEAVEDFEQVDRDLWP